MTIRGEVNEDDCSRGVQGALATMDEVQAKRETVIVTREGKGGSGAKRRLFAVIVIAI